MTLAPDQSHAAVPTKAGPSVPIIVALLAAGLLLWIAFGRAGFRYGLHQLAWLAALLVPLAIPAWRTRLHRLLESIRQPGARTATLAAITITILSTLYLIFTGWYQQRSFIPRFHDEHMYLLQMQMLARGRLWMPQHPLADFFETTHVLVKPVYAAIYFPGTALMYLPTVWLKLPIWLMPAIVSGATVGLFYKLVTDLIDGLAGALAALLMLALMWFRYLALIVMSHTVMTFLGIAIILTWMQWRRERRTAWLVLLGTLCGWAAITRPVDAIVYVAPMGLAMLLDLRGLPFAKKLASLAIPTLAGAPFLAIQIILNLGVTGHALTTPYRVYVDQFNPQISYGFHPFDESIRPRTDLPQRQEYYDKFIVPDVKAHRPENIVPMWLKERFPRLVWVTLPSTLLLLLLPLALLALDSAPRRVLAAVLPVYIALYALFTYLLPHYLVVIAPPVIFLGLLGRHVLDRALGLRATSITTVSILAMTMPFFAELNPGVEDDGFETPTMAYSHIVLPQLVQKPAIVLFRYAPGGNINEEPVYNEDVPWPDDAPIIRAHDLGAARNRELLDYYAQRQPNRHVYLFDRGTAELTYYGTVAELARRVTTQPAPP